MEPTNHNSSPKDETITQASKAKPINHSQVISNSGLTESGDLSNLVGQTIVERYHLIKVLGKGGMGVVFEAIDLVDNSRIAIKLLSAQVLSDEIAKKRFYREAKTGIALSHPNIVKAYHYGNVDELVFICMEYIRGQSLREFINNYAPLTPIKILSIVEQLCHALDYAHNNGVLHRDLKPSNILLDTDKDGAIQVKLADFGIAKLLSPNEDITHGTSITENGVILGTVNYIAPEYLLGLNLTAASDLYSLGVIIYEMLTEHLPVCGTSKQQLLYNKVYKDLELPSQKHTFLPTALDPVLTRLLNRNPLLRFNTGQEFCQAFRQAVE